MGVIHNQRLSIHETTVVASVSRLAMAPARGLHRLLLEIACAAFFLVFKTRPNSNRNWSFYAGIYVL